MLLQNMLMHYGDLQLEVRLGLALPKTLSGLLKSCSINVLYIEDNFLLLHLQEMKIVVAAFYFCDLVFGLIWKTFEIGTQNLIERRDDAEK